MKRNYLLLTSLILIATYQNWAQQPDTIYARKVIETLSSAKFNGRGYVKKGDKKAAAFIVSELKKMQVKPLYKNYLQQFSFPINTYPGKMEVQIDNLSLKPVTDFVIAPNSKAIKGSFPLIYLPPGTDTLPWVIDSLKQCDFSGKFIVVPFKMDAFKDSIPFNARGVIVPKEKIYWWGSTAHEEKELVIMHIQDSLLKQKPSMININFENKFITNYTTQNIAGFISGTHVPDSLIVFSAHYDHLGTMGKNIFFPGANDNASGTSMVLSLAQYFSKPEHTPEYSVVFMLFGAEESGLLGSQAFVYNPAFPLENIKSVINLDMVGSGSKGLSIVNGKANPEITKKIESLNQQNQFFDDIRIGGPSCNSDHCFFDKAGVPAVFIFTRGPECQEYHNLKDISPNTPLTKFMQLRQLLVNFVEYKPQ